MKRIKGVKVRAVKSAGRVLVSCDDGPWAGSCLALAADGDSNTAWIMVAGVEGRYRAGTWQTWAAYEAKQANDRKRVEEIAARERARWAKYDEREAA